MLNVDIAQVQRPQIKWANDAANNYAYGTMTVTNSKTRQKTDWQVRVAAVNGDLLSVQSVVAQQQAEAAVLKLLRSRADAGDLSTTRSMSLTGNTYTRTDAATSRTTVGSISSRIPRLFRSAKALSADAATAYNSFNEAAKTDANVQSGLVRPVDQTEAKRLADEALYGRVINKRAPAARSAGSSAPHSRRASVAPAPHSSSSSSAPAQGRHSRRSSFVDQPRVVDPASARVNQLRQHTDERFDRLESLYAQQRPIAPPYYVPVQQGYPAVPSLYEAVSSSVAVSSAPIVLEAVADHKQAQIDALSRQTKEQAELISKLQEQIAGLTKTSNENLELRQNTQDFESRLEDAQEIAAQKARELQSVQKEQQLLRTELDTVKRDLSFSQEDVRRLGDEKRSLENERDSLISRLTSQTEELATAQEQLSSKHAEVERLTWATQQNSQLAEKLALAQIDLLDTKKEVDRLTASEADLKLQLKTLDDKEAALSSELLQVKGQLDKAESDNQVLVSDKADLQAQLDAANAQIATATQKVHDLNLSLESGKLVTSQLESSNQGLSSELITAQLQIVQLTKRVAELESALAEQIARSLVEKREFQNRLTEVQDQLQKTEKAVELQQQKILELTAAMQKEIDTVNNLRENNTALSVQLETLNNDNTSKNEEIERLRAENLGLTQELERVRTESEINSGLKALDIESKLLENQFRRTLAEETIASNNSLVDFLTSTVRSNLEQIRSLHEENDQLTFGLNQASDAYDASQAQVEVLTAQVTKTQQQLSNALTRITTLEAENAEKTVEIAHFSDQIQQLQAEFLQQAAIITSKDEELLKASRASTAAESSMNSQNSALLSEIERLKQNLQKAQDQHQQDLLKKSELEVEVVKLRASKEAAVALSAKLDEVKAALADARAQNEALNRGKALLEKNVSDLTKKVDSLTAAKRLSEATVDQLRKELAEKTASVASLEEKAQRATAMIEGQEKELNVLRQAGTSKSRTITDLEGKIQGLRANLGETKAQVQTARQEMSALQTQHAAELRMLEQRHSKAKTLLEQDLSDAQARFKRELAENQAIIEANGARIAELEFLVPAGAVNGQEDNKGLTSYLTSGELVPAPALSVLEDSAEMVGETQELFARLEVSKEAVLRANLEYHNTSRQNRIEELEIENAALQTEVEETHTLFIEAGTRAEQAEAGLEASVQVIAHAEQELEAVRERNTELEARVNGFSAQRQKEIQEESALREELENQLATQALTVNLLRTKLQEQEKAHEIDVREITFKDTDLESKDSEILRFQNKITQLHTEHGQKQKEMTTEIEKLKEQALRAQESARQAVEMRGRLEQLLKTDGDVDVVQDLEKLVYRNNELEQQLVAIETQHAEEIAEYQELARKMQQDYNEQITILEIGLEQKGSPLRASRRPSMTPVLSRRESRASSVSPSSASSRANSKARRPLASPMISVPAETLLTLRKAEDSPISKLSFHSDSDDD